MGNGYSGTDTPIRRGVRTGADNEVKLKPFAVLKVTVPAEWDVQAGKLKLSYEVKDPNGRAKSGRIVYAVPTVAPEVGPPESEWTVVHAQKLTVEQIKHGAHELTNGEQWDGSITEGINDRKKVTADLGCPLGVRVELWNTGSDAPGNLASGNSGATDVEGEYLSRASASTRIPFLKLAKWTRHFVVPYKPITKPKEPKLEKKKGVAHMDIRVRNVADGTKVLLRVARITDISNPKSDTVYDQSGLNDKSQPGLKDPVVKGGKVVLPDGKKSYVRFDNYKKHWKKLGNNFYCIWMAFKNRGDWVPVSERDYKLLNHRADKRAGYNRDCLHLRYTVFINRPSSDLPEYTKYAKKLRRFLKKKTRFFRPYLMTGGPKYVKQWGRYMMCTYLTVFLGHASCDCTHDDHPKNSKGKRRPLYDQGFEPDGGFCPTTVSDDPKVQKSLAAEEKKDRKKYYKKWPKNEPLYGGCGHKSGIEHSSYLGKRKGYKYYWYNISPHTKAELPAFVPGKLVKGEVKEWGRLKRCPIMGLPRFLFFNGGCRTMLTDNLGQDHVGHTDDGTRYYHGWVYSPGCDYGKFCYDIFTRWIETAQKNDPFEETELLGFEDAYRWAANKGTRADYHPRLMDQFGRIDTQEAPDKAERAL